MLDGEPHELRGAPQSVAARHEEVNVTQEVLLLTRANRFEIQILHTNNTVATTNWLNDVQKLSGAQNELSEETKKKLETMTARFVNDVWSRHQSITDK